MHICLQLRYDTAAYKTQDPEKKVKNLDFYKKCRFILCTFYFLYFFISIMAGSSEEIERIISEIRHLIPSIRVTEDDILNPKHEFVKTFCEQALNYYDKKIGFIATKEETALVNTAINEFTSLGYGAEMALFVRISCITGQISGNTKFTVIDFFKPPKQRTKAFLRIILNFLLYIDNEVQNNQHIMEECTKKIETSKELEDKRNALLETINETVKTTAGKEDLVNSFEAGILLEICF